MLLRKFFSYYAPFKGLFALDFGCAVVAGLLELAFPMAIKLFIDRLLPAGDWTLIIVAAAGLTVVYVMNAGMMAIVTYWGHMLGINIETEMRRRAFDHLQKLSFSFYDGAKTGHLTARVTKDLEEVGELAHHGPEEVFLAIMTFVGAFLLMTTINVELALIVGAIVPAIGWLTMSVGTRMTHNFRALFRRVGAFNARLEENIGGMRVVQAFANEAHETALFADDNAQVPHHEAAGLPLDGGELGALLLRATADPGRRDGHRHLVRHQGRAHGGRLRQLPAVDHDLFRADREDQPHPRDVPQGDRGLPVLPRPSGDRAGHRRPAGC